MEMDSLASQQGSNDNRPSLGAMRAFRKLWPHDADAFGAHLVRLDPQQRSFRFGRAVADEWVAGYAAGTDWFRAVILGCWIAGELRGVVELKLLDHGWPPSAEAALSVERAFEGRGMGTALFHRGLVIARNRGIVRVIMLCVPENLRVQRVVRKVQSKLTYDGDQVEIDLAPLDALSIAAEFYDEGCGLALSFWDWQRRLAPAA
jgi:GNAT superfamily N-acetyltransferase